MSFPDEDIVNAYYDYIVEQGTTEDRKRLFAIIHNELGITQQTIDRSPDLRSRGQEVPCRNWHYHTGTITGNFANTTYASMEYSSETTYYWKLDVTNLVYVATHRIGHLADDGIVDTISIEHVSQRDLEEIIQGLRLLRTPFNGAIVE